MYRIRRNKIVEIPEEWVGRIATKKKIRQRKISAKIKKLDKRVRIKKESDVNMSLQDY